MNCPNCGAGSTPLIVTRGSITFYNCAQCDFSSWDPADYGAPRTTDNPLEDSAYVRAQLVSSDTDPTEREIDAYLAAIEEP